MEVKSFMKGFLCFNFFLLIDLLSFVMYIVVSWSTFYRLEKNVEFFACLFKVVM